MVDGYSQGNDSARPTLLFPGANFFGQLKGNARHLCKRIVQKADTAASQATVRRRAKPKTPSRPNPNITYVDGSGTCVRLLSMRKARETHEIR